MYKECNTVSNLADQKTNWISIGPLFVCIEVLCLKKDGPFLM
jgi:hypothetical protein